MLEIDITRIAIDCDPFDFSASRAERGANAGPETWANAKAEAASAPLITSASDLNAARDYFRGFGAWDDAEIAAWTPDDVNALVIQYVSGDLREAESLCAGDGPGGIDWDAYETLAERGTVSGAIYASGEAIYASLSA